MTDALSAAAQELQLDGYSASNTPKQNQTVFLTWMRRTDQEWLIIFDNVDDKDALKDAWPPSGSKGSVLITCRSEIVASSRAREALEVPTLERGEGAQLMACLLRRSNLSEDETAACAEFSERLGGLPLAIILMGNKIRVRKRTVRSFIPSFDEEGMASLQKGRRDIGDPYYDKSMDKVWEEAFKGLAKESGQLLLLLCFFGPENIPLSAVQSENIPDLPQAWKFLRDANKMDDATLELMDLSLIRINETGTMISVHRLIQLGYLDANIQKAKVEAFDIAFRLLRHSFPARGRGHLFDRWGICQPLAPHVLLLQRRQADLSKAGFSSKEAALTVLVTDTAWYLMETGNWQTAENSLRLALEQNSDKNSIEQAEIEQVLASISVRSGHCGAALERYRRILEIRKGKFPADSNQMANAYSSLAFTLTAMYRLPEAFEYFTNVFACIEGKDVETQRKNYNVDRFLRNRARANYYRGEFASAIEDLDEADRHQSAMYGSRKHYHGETAYTRGKIAYKQGDLTAAYNHFEFAAQAISAGKETYRTIISTSYQQGCIRLRQGDYNGALVHLRSALHTCKVNQTCEDDNRDLARIQWRMAQVLNKLGRDENEARELDQKARESKMLMEKTGMFSSPPAELGEEEEWDCFIGLLYR
ncbi:hypothetical protein B0T24DRAFT_719511 [Lasiosphaeria ovina]|uniref:DUF7779 domain-containing protein n=1 Tax=Lasiosphaeria ovina TaxID=92902 RepID=A0AAE0KIE8_9PEZI|nr:hypothetical protein B0T24DRAFT_719511 [Lasiosphaeria ovina]